MNSLLVSGKDAEEMLQAARVIVVVVVVVVVPPTHPPSSNANATREGYSFAVATA